MKNLRLIKPKECCSNCKFFEVEGMFDWLCNVNGKDEPITIEGILGASAGEMVCDDYKPFVIFLKDDE